MIDTDGMNESNILEKPLHELNFLIMLAGICFLLISIAQLLRVQTVYAYMVEMFIIGACVACASVFLQSLLQSYTPDYMTGRVFSISSLIGNIFLPIAYAIFGILLDFSSILNVMTACGA